MDTIQVVWARYMSAFVLAPVHVQSDQAPARHAHEQAVAAAWPLHAAAGLDRAHFVRAALPALDQAIAIIFCTRVHRAALGGPILGEWIKWRRWTAIVVGFCGVLLVARPGAGGISSGGDSSR